VSILLRGVLYGAVAGSAPIEPTEPTAGGKRLDIQDRRSRRFSKHCIYAIRHSEQLDHVYGTSRIGEFQENTNWKTGKKLFEDAQADGEILPIIFGAAEANLGLIYWARLTGVQVDDAGETTTYLFTNLARIAPARDKNDLTVVSTGLPLPNDYIRSYVLCETPIWVRWAAVA
jgi:hypothetical protein